MKYGLGSVCGVVGYNCAFSNCNILGRKGVEICPSLTDVVAASKYQLYLHKCYS